MDYEHRSDCWYKDVCTQSICDSCERFLEMSYLMEASGIPKSKQTPAELTPEDIDYDSFCYLAIIKGSMVEFVDNGGQLYICSSNTGNGKTSWAIKLMLKYFDSIWAGNGLRIRGMFVHVPTLLMQLKNFNDPMPESYKRYFLDVDLIVWDDIAHADISKYDYTNLLMILDTRILNDKANIFTSNITNKRKLDECVGVKLSSRIWNSSMVIEFKGKDRRKHGNFTDSI